MYTNVEMMKKNKTMYQLFEKYSGIEIPYVLWSDTDRGVCEVYIHDRDGNFIRDKNDNILTGIVKGEFYIVEKKY